MTYARVAKGSSKYLTVNKKTGNVIVKRDAPKKTLVIMIKVTAVGNANYKAGSKTVTCKIAIK